MRVLLTGTGTGVGKTWVAARLLRALRAAGVDVAAWKPAQSFSPDEGPTDAEVLAAATGQRPEDVCPPHRWYPVPLAPPEAADELGLPPFTIVDLLTELPAPDPVAGEGDGVLVVEGAGGPRSPLATDGDTVAFGRLLAPQMVVLVAPAGLGTVNDVRLCSDALAGVAPMAVHLNRYDPAGRVCVRNAAFLRRDGLEVVTDIAALERLVHAHAHV